MSEQQDRERAFCLAMVHVAAELLPRGTEVGCVLITSNGASIQASEGLKPGQIADALRALAKAVDAQDMRQGRIILPGGRS